MKTDYFRNKRYLLLNSACYPYSAMLIHSDASHDYASFDSCPLSVYDDSRGCFVDCCNWRARSLVEYGTPPKIALSLGIYIGLSIPSNGWTGRFVPLKLLFFWAFLSL